MTTITTKASRIELFNFSTASMRAFHLSWIAFFLCFFGWFGIAPLMPIIRDELGLSKTQIGNLMIASVSVTIFARLAIGWILDRIGPRITYTYLLIIGSIPLFLIGLSHSYETFLIYRLAIGAIGASFVITQYHTTLMFAPNVVGTANATTAGWGNLGGGFTQIVMPLIFAGLVGLGFVESSAWRWAMAVPGVAMVFAGIAYFRWTTDLPEGNFKEFRRVKKSEKNTQKSLKKVVRDHRVWVLFVIYGACFGMELTVNNVAAIYFHDYFQLDLATAGLIAGLFGSMNLFARSLGGLLGDRAGGKMGLKGRVLVLGGVLLLEGIFLVWFSQASALLFAIPLLILFSVFVQMAEGCTFAVVPFINRKNTGLVSGIVGAGGNAGAVMAGLLFRMDSLSYSNAFWILGLAVIGVSVLSLAVRFSPQEEKTALEELQLATLTTPN